MTPEFAAHNPFMLMLQPEAVLAAVEKSERLSRLNRHLCRPLDRPVLQGAAVNASAVHVADDDIEIDDLSTGDETTDA